MKTVIVRSVGLNRYDSGVVDDGTWTCSSIEEYNNVLPILSRQCLKLAEKETTLFVRMWVIDLVTGTVTSVFDREKPTLTRLEVNVKAKRKVKDDPFSSFIGNHPINPITSGLEWVEHHEESEEHPEEELN